MKLHIRDILKQSFEFQDYLDEFELLVQDTSEDKRLSKLQLVEERNP